MRYCSKQHPQHFEKDKFCRDCGENLDNSFQPKCSNGHNILTRDEYCGTCGVKTEIKPV